MVNVLLVADAAGGAGRAAAGRRLPGHGRDRQPQQPVLRFLFGNDLFEIPEALPESR